MSEASQPELDEFVKELKNVFEDFRYDIQMKVRSLGIRAAALIGQLQSEKAEQAAEIERLRKRLHFELPEKYPDNCEICKGVNLGVRGNENVVDGKKMCDYCHARTLKGKK